MGIRDVMDAHPRATTGVVSVVVVASIAAAVVQLMGNRRGISTKLPDAYFTDDDGKTFFVASADNVPPFDHNGKTAVAAHVYRCEGHAFVAFVSRFTPEARARIIKSKSVSASDETWGRELKRPGDVEWVKGSDQQRVGRIADVRGPKGQTEVEPMEPDA